MNLKESSTKQFDRKNRFHQKMMDKSVYLYAVVWGEYRTLRKAIQFTKENFRDGKSGGQKGRVFVGNSTKYYQGLPEDRILNAILKRNQLGKKNLMIG